MVIPRELSIQSDSKVCDSECGSHRKPKRVYAGEKESICEKQLCMISDFVGFECHTIGDTQSAQLINGMLEGA